MRPEALRWLRVSYRAGAAVDFAAGLMMLLPDVFAWMNQPVNFHPADDFRYAMGMGAPLMFGWTVLLLWADRRPLERMGVLPITLLVVIGEVLTQVWGVKVGFMPFGALAPTFVIQSAIFSLFLFSYFQARRMA